MSAIKDLRIGPAPYASGKDFCAIFERDMNSLYALSFLLTGDPAQAEKCFVQGLQDAREGNRVFKEWAETWARRTIILNAIRLLRPAPGASGPTPDPDVVRSVIRSREIAALVELSTFERFVFVMSVLERYSDRECALLLGCTRDVVTATRVRLLETSGDSEDLRNKLLSADVETQLHFETLRKQESIARLAFTAS